MLRRLGITAASDVFVGDNYTADYISPKPVGMTAFLLDSAGRADVPELK